MSIVSKLLLCGIVCAIAGCSNSTTRHSDCPTVSSDLLVPPRKLESTHNDPERAAWVIPWNAEALLADRSRLERWQAWYNATRKGL
ncbi:Rz-like spanin [Edwardsiella phage PEi21]|uniref:Putative outer membrane spanin subunit n=1 Tax=Edwardsiella phage PEi21 TaxID=1325372 RepID=N0DP82_9CAUD|nr:Rz-like spanin [Edwardsiella phage PEi21]BAN16856.2 putative outer membrane spanin subunit [Edwardsiella phage PEi21]